MTLNRTLLERRAKWFDFMNQLQKNPLIGGFIKLWQHIKYASNMAYFVAFCKRV
ncbi:hypothetical protein [Escherichia coli Nissle 1917]|nr:hypothetical protein [Escherichia coli Nissle 1917]